MNEPTASVLAAIAAGHRLAGDERHPKACTMFEQALQELAEATDRDTPAQLAMRVEIVSALVESQVECDRLDAATQTLAQAQALRDHLAECGVVIAPLVEARLALMAARLRIQRREPGAAIGPLQDAIATLTADPVPAGHALTAACHTTLAVAFSLGGRFDEAAQQRRAAGELLDTPALRHLGKERARLSMNIGNDEWFQGRPQEAVRRFNGALAIFRGLVAAGSLDRRIDIARTSMNLGGALTSCDAFDAAIDAYDEALRLYALEIRRARRAGSGLGRLRASLASTRMNLGYALFRAGRHDAAGAMLRLALRDYKLIVASAPHLADDEARTWVNQAHLLHRQGRLDAARRGYGRALRTFAPLISAGRVHLEGDLANARLGLARVLASQGRFDAALREGEAALRSLAGLTRAGQLHHARAWLLGLRGLGDALLANAAAGSGRTLLALAACVADALVRGHPVGAEQLDELFDAVDQVGLWRRISPADAAALNGWIAAYLRHLLEWIAQLLGESDPSWLQSHAAALADLVECLRESARGEPKGDALLADWFLSTRALRAQRNALAQSGDPRVQELAALLQRLRQLEEELLGGRPDPALGSDGAVRASGAAPASVATADGARAAWSTLRRRCDELRGLLTRDGRVPPQTHLPASDVVQQLPHDAGLVLLARPTADRVVVITLHRPDSQARWASADEVVLTAGLAQFRCNELVGLVRRSIVGAARGQGLRRASDPPMTDAPLDATAGEIAGFACSALSELARAVATPIWARVRQHRWRSLHIVPSDDLHLVPWAHELESERPQECSLAVYPSVGAWFHHRADATADATTPASVPRRWAVAAWPAAGSAHALPWVEVEHALCRMLWGTSQPVAIDSAHRIAEGIDAFVGMGHGRAVHNNPAHAGVQIDTHDVLTAHDLPAMRTCRAVVLSCCVLGQTHEVFGEPLGFLSAAFGYEVAFGSGWLTEVPDAWACLFGAAFQFALRDVGGGSWRGTFEAVRRDIAAGRWPQGFGAWLETNLPAAVVAARSPQWHQEVTAAIAGGALYRIPPHGLSRLMPWVICFGG